MVATNSVGNAGELLFAALDGGDMEESNEILDGHPESVDARDEELRVPLHYAADCADLETFQRILNKFGFTPLLVSVMAGNLEVLESLIEQGAQLDLLDRDGHSAVHWAVVCGQLDVLIALQRHGAPIALADVHGAHPLHYATVRSALEEEVPPYRAEAVLHVLLRHGAQLECADVDGRTPLLWAASDGNLPAFRSLVQKGANRFSVDPRPTRRSPLCRKPRIRAMTVDAKDRNSDTPLFYAATFGHCECAKLLLDKGANVNQTRIRTAAHCAAAKGQLRVLKLLRQFGASFSLQNYRGDLPFHEAVQTGLKDVIEWFLDIEPNFVSAPNFCGRAPLHLAASKGNIELVVLLCTRGAQINALMMHKGQLLTPLDVAKSRGHELVIDYLSGKHGALTAAGVSPEGRDFQRLSIEERLKTAKLRKMHVELMAYEEVTREGTQSLLERGHSVRTSKKARRADRREMVDAYTTMSRRSSSASAGSFHFPKKVPRTTSTTDLLALSPSFYAQRGGGNGRGKGQVMQNETERAEMEKTIQRIVQEELQNTANWESGAGQDSVENEESKRRRESVESEKIAEQEERESEREGGGQNIVPTPAAAVAEFRAKHSARGNKVRTPASDHEEEDVHRKIGGRVRLKMEDEGVRVGEEKGTRQQRILRRMTPRGAQRADEDEEDVGEVTELHILEQGLSPPVSQQPIGRMAQFANNTNHHAPRSSITRRYIHEKAIFDELTHLKRMQLQYRRVSEAVLVRSLVQNFCRMHSINPAHFRRVHTFHQWEKFLYDQLKLIYLEERDRISAAAIIASQRAAAAAGAVGTRPAVLYSAQQRVFAGTASAAIGGTAPMGALILRKFDSRVLPRTDPLEERMHELNRIYGSGSSSRNSVTLTATHSIAAQPLADTQRRRRRREKKEETKDGKTMSVPIVLLREGTQSKQGRDQILSNISACCAVADNIRTTLGPRGLDKLLVDRKGQTTISNDGATILKQLDIVFPAAVMMCDIAKSQDAEVGDGTTSVVLLAAEFLKSVKPFVEEGVSPQLVIKAFNAASQEAIKKLHELAIKVQGTEESREMLIRCAATTLSSKLLKQERHHFASMVVSAVDHLDVDLPLNMIGIKKVSGGSIKDSRLVTGVAFKKAFSYAGFEMQPKHYKEPLIAVLNIELELKAERDNAELRIGSVADYQEVVNAEWTILYQKLEKIHESGAKIVLSKLPIGDVATQWFADRDMFCAGRIQEDDLGRVMAACGGSTLTTVSQIDKSVLGKCAEFYEQQVGSERYNFFIDGSKEKSCTLLLRGGAEQFIAETERSLHDAIMIVRRAKKNDSIVAGGGAIEMELSKHLLALANSREMKDQFFWKAYAKAFEMIPQQLCQNAGVDSISTLGELRAAHQRGEKWAGVDIQRECVADNMDGCVWEPALVKENAIVSATEAACLVLSIDQTIKNPKNKNEMPGLPGQ
uniref:T-complex protein 1 subunit eta n=1 Tax=Globodera rostochiensis TaxID=31243 RepID=A0A914HEW9_GLORO